MLLTLRFSREFGLIFCGVAGFFEDLRVACWWACFNLNLLVFWACFFQTFGFWIAFFSNSRHFCCFNSPPKGYWAYFHEICSFWTSFFGFASLFFYLILLLIFRFVEFSCQRMLGLFFGKFPIFGLFFKFSCLFLQNNLASLGVIPVP